MLVAVAEPTGDPVLVWRAARRLGIPASAAEAAQTDGCEAGLLAQLVIWVYAMAALATRGGDFAAAASLITEAEAIAAATGTRFPPSRPCCSPASGG